VGDNVYAVGNPEGLEGTFSQGLVSGIRQRGSDSILQITAPISPGSSGGPVLNTKGEVVGVAVSTSTEGQNLNFAVPANYLAVLLKNRTPPSGLSQSSTSAPAQDHSVFEGLGGDSRDGLALGQFRWDCDSYNCYFSFSVRNQLNESVRAVKCLVIFYDTNREPVDSKVVQVEEVIAPGSAKRVVAQFVADSVFKIVEAGSPDSSHRRAENPRSGAVQFRVLDFAIAR
jgi:hypothetical protein